MRLDWPRLEWLEVAGIGLTLVLATALVFVPQQSVYFDQAGAKTAVTVLPLGAIGAPLVRALSGRTAAPAKPASLVDWIVFSSYVSASLALCLGLGVGIAVLAFASAVALGLHQPGHYLLSRFGLGGIMGMALWAWRSPWIYEPDELACRHCGYCLRGLTSARCPECGQLVNSAAKRTDG